MNPSEFDLWMRAELDTVERALQRWVPPGAPARLGDAMRRRVLVRRNILCAEAHPCEAGAYFNTILQRIGHAGFKTFSPQKCAIT